MQEDLSKVYIDGDYVPRFFYGTAWKEDKTADLTYQALLNGFTAIDTANQRKHYFEAAVGEGIQRYLIESGTAREDLFLQTKYTFARGQDHRKPYREEDRISQQVADSFASSLTHLQTDYVDSLVLHGPYGHLGIGEEDIEAWGAMEEIFDNEHARHLGISNVTALQLKELCDQGRVKPTFVQNRCFARLGWDRDVRHICSSEGIIYQGFSLLTANQNELASPAIIELAEKYGKTVPQLIFRFCQQINMICLTGTNKIEHMKEDLNIYDFELTEAEVSMIESINF